MSRAAQFAPERYVRARRVCWSVGTEAAVGLRGSQDGYSEREDLDPNAPGLQETSSERSLVGGPKQEKEFGPSSVVFRTFCGRLYRSHRDGELPVSGPRRRGRRAGLGAHAACVCARGCVGGWMCAGLAGLAAVPASHSRRLWRSMCVMVCEVCVLCDAFCFGFIPSANVF